MNDKSQPLLRDDKPHYVPSRLAAEQLGVAQSTLRRWDREGKIRTLRTPGEHRLYDLSTFTAVNGARTQEERAQLRGAESPWQQDRRVIAYARVSGAKQKEDLQRQCHFLRQQYPACEVLSDIGSGLNWKRKNLQRILRCVMQGKVKRLVVSHKDRLCRFAFELIAFICREHNTELVVHHSAEEGSHQELIEDLMAVTHVFSSKLYGKRNTGKRKRVPVDGAEQAEVPVGGAATEDSEAEQDI